MEPIKTWRQGYFVDQHQYERWTKKEKEEADKVEKHLVRPTPLGNAICFCPNPEDAVWIAERLNLAAIRERANEESSL